MVFELNLEKAKTSLVLCLEKAGILKPPVMDMAFLLDVSSSFDDEHRSGITNDMMSRLVPWGMVFDPDKKFEVYTFSNGPSHVHQVGDVNASNYKNYIQREIIDNVDGYNGGTDYSYALEASVQNFGWGVAPKSEEKQGFLSKLFGKKQTVNVAPVVPKTGLVVMLTDGDNSDKYETIQVLQNAKNNGYKVFFLFIGVSNQANSFSFLKKLEKDFENVGFYAINDLKKFVNSSDDEINQALISQKLIDFLGNQ